MSVTHRHSSPSLPRLARLTVRWAAYPLLVFGSIVPAILAMQRGWADPSTIAGALVLLVGLLIVVMEQVQPDRRQRVSVRTIWVDVLHNLLSSGGVSSLVRALAFGSLVAFGAWLSAALGVGLWPQQWPLLLQFLLAVVLGEFGSYWAHRIMHRYELLWRLHALHHSPPHLYVLASGRSHPLNALIVHTCQVAPAIVLGAGGETIALAALFTATTGLFQHCNIELRTEWLNWLLATPDLHRTHHSVEMEESNTNFGNNIILWDLVFGTRLTDRRPPEYGVAGVAWPDSYLGHLATPFIYGRISQPAPAPEREPALAAPLVRS
jgi:ornithine lipid hydroxylase